jgi:penicillin-binding protein 2
MGIPISTVIHPTPSHNPFEPTSIGEHNAHLLTEGEPSFSLPLGSADEGVVEPYDEQRSFSGLTLFCATILVVLASQCFHLQVTKGSENKARAEGNSIRILTTPADRGLIKDIHGVILAQNAAHTALVITPQGLPNKKSDRQAVYAQLKQQAGIDDDTITLIETNWKKSSAPLVLKNNLSQDTKLLYKERFASLQGVTVEDAPVRLYSPLPSLGQLLGYVGTVSQSDVNAGATLDQHVGKTGIEQHYNAMLSGIPGHQKAEVDALGKVRALLPQEGLDLAKTGQTLTLSLDSDIQKSLAQALQHGIDRRTKEFGPQDKLGVAGVVLDVHTGAIKAMVSLPDYDANLFSGGISKDDYQNLLSNPGNPLLNEAIAGQFASGSIIKPLMASAALQEGVITGDTQMDTPAALCVGKTCFPDWKNHVHTDTRTAISTSNNIFFYAIGGGWPDRNIKGLGIDRMDTYLHKFGLGNPTSIDIPGERSGLVPSPGWKQKNQNEKWFIGDTYNTAIGQGYTLVTPLQMADATAAIANGGTLWQPSLGWSTTKPDTGEETLLPHTSLQQDLISPENLQIVREGMMKTTQPGGSANPLHNLTVCSAGKTGTAQFGTNGQTHAWYIGFAPCDNPQIAFAIYVGGGGESFTSSVPVAEELLRALYNDPLQPGQPLSSEPRTGSVGEFSGER